MVSGGRLLVGEMEVSWFTNRPPLLCLPWQVVIICFLQIDASQSVVGVLALGYGSRLFGGELVVSWFNNRPPLVCLPWQIVIFCSCKRCSEWCVMVVSASCSWSFLLGGWLGGDLIY